VTAGAPAQRLEVDVAALRQAAWLRMLAALLSALSSLWLLAVTESWWLRAVALAGLAFAALWARAQRRVLGAEVSRVSRDYLELGEHHLAIVQQGQARSLSLASVRRIELDDDRLEVVLHLDSGEQLRLEPRYRGVGLRDLGKLLHDAVEHATRAAADAPRPIMVTIPGDGRTQR
jgi:hypothetical protein